MLSDAYFKLEIIIPDQIFVCKLNNSGQVILKELILAYFLSGFISMCLIRICINDVMLSSFRSFEALVDYFFLQVRSLTLDVKVWDPSVLNLFMSLGNVYVNSIWEELLHSKSTFQADEMRKG
jgi:hypothetical protein